MLKKIEAMYKYYGKRVNEKCNGCCHLAQYPSGAKLVNKCEAYGVSRGNATDWNSSYNACGIYNDRYHDGLNEPLFYRLKIIKDKNEIIEGQLSLKF